MPCFDQAARGVRLVEARRRSPAPCATATGWSAGVARRRPIRPRWRPPTARVRLFPDGTARVETAGHEIGNGIYTVAAQTAAERLGLPVEKVSVLLGDTDLPPAPVAGGSISTASVCSVVAQACDAIRAKLEQRIGAQPPTSSPR